MKLEGSLDAFSLPDVFQLLSLTKKSGGLHLSHVVSAGPVHGVVYFRNGAVTGAVADSSRQGLARRLVGMGVVDDAALRRAVDRAAAEPTGVARALLQAGAADPETVRSLAGAHTIDAVFDLLRWPEGDFSFAVDEADPDDVGLDLAADEVVAEATARRATWDGVSRIIPSPDVVLIMPVVLQEALVEPALTRDEWSLLALVDGARTVGELVEVSGAGQYGVVSSLATLVQRGLLSLRDEDSPEHVVLVRRRQALLAALEGAPTAQAQPEPQPDLEPLTSHEPVAPPPGPAVSDQAVAAPGAATPAAATTHLIAPLVAQQTGAQAPNAPVPAAAPAAHAGGAREPSGIVPPRPEPFLPRRPVVHPEPPATGYGAATSPPASAAGRPTATAPGGGPAGVPGGTAGGAALNAHPSAQSLIERDPSVNRSLLLRLIAGVRGL